MPRHIRLEALHNLRDFGGYDTACGRGLKPGLLFRSAAHHAATDADLKVLAALAPAVIVDLRRPDERAREPSRRWPGFSARVVENEMTDEAENTWAAMVRAARPTPASLRARNLAWYRNAVHEPRHLRLFARYFEVLAEAGGPVLIHCAAGKDRTGLLAALTQHAAGVSREDVLADYLMTNDLGVLEARLPGVRATIAELTGEVPDDETVYAAMRVLPEYLAAGFEAIEGRHGSIDAYLEGPLGFTPERRRAFEARFLG